MDIVLIIAGLLLIVAGIAGAVLPVLPGLPLSYAGILLLHFSKSIDFSLKFLIFWAVVIILVQLLDYLIPIWGTRKFGGSKRGVWGSATGMLAGLFFAPWGIIIGPFLGAVIFELTGGKETRAAIKAGFGAFVGFISGVVVKLVAGGFLLYYGVTAIF